jgi:hypothetical protein
MVGLEAAKERIEDLRREGDQERKGRVALEARRRRRQ